MGAKFDRAREIYRTNGVAELAVRTKDWWAQRARRWLRRPRMELQKPYLKLKYGRAAPHPLKVIELTPERITYMLRPNFFSRTDKKYGTFVVGGEWDREWYDSETERGLMKFKEYCLHQSAIEYFDDGREWRETSGFEEGKLDYHGPNWYSDVAEIYENIQEMGYRRQRALDTGMEEDYSECGMPPEYDEVRVGTSQPA